MKQKSSIENIDYCRFGSFKLCHEDKQELATSIEFLKRKANAYQWLQQLDRDSTLIDVGASIGIFSIPAALFHVDRVIAIEPNLSKFNLLAKNIRLNDLTTHSILPVPIAISTEFDSKIIQYCSFLDETVKSKASSKQEFNHQPFARSLYSRSLSSIIKENIEPNSPLHIKIGVGQIQYDLLESLFKEKAIHRITSILVELCPNIKSHEELINRLQNTGYIFEQSKVGLGNSNYEKDMDFSVYVFRKFVPKQLCEITSSFMKNKYKTSIEYSKLKESQLMKSSNDFKFTPSGIQKISRLPSTYALKTLYKGKELNHLPILMVDAALQSSFEVSPFRFEGSVTETNTPRYLLPRNSLQKLDSQYFSKVISLLNSRELFYLVKECFDDAISEFKLTELSNRLYGKKESIHLEYKLVPRFRHFVDLHSFKLDRHIDSPDTFAAVIIPLMPYATTTSLVSGGLFDREYLKLTKEQISIDKSSFSKERLIGTSQHIPSIYFSFSVRDNKKLKLNGAPMNNCEISLQPGEGLIIPNISCIKSFGILTPQENNLIADYDKFSAHAVLPGVRELYRPVLLIDYILKPMVEDIKSDEYGNNINNFLSYSK